MVEPEASLCSELALLQSVNVVAELECGPQLQTHVLHHHVTAQQEQGLAVNLLVVWRKVVSEAWLVSPPQVLIKGHPGKCRHMESRFTGLHLLSPINSPSKHLLLNLPSRVLHVYTNFLSPKPKMQLNFISSRKPPPSCIFHSSQTLFILTLNCYSMSHLLS